MIEIKEKVEQVVYFPKNSNEVLEIYSLELHSELTQKSYTFSVVDSGNSNRYYKFTVDFSDVDDGEYNYSISGIDTGLIRIGEINKEYSVSSFDDDVEVIQYGSNVKPIYQHKEVNINEDGTYVITPDDGYDALSKVTAYVNIPQTGHTDEEMEEAYDSGYTNGYNSGYTSGKTEGYQSGYTAGYNSGSTDGYNSGYTSGKTEGYQSGYTAGYNSGSTDGYNSGYTSGKTEGYQSGYTAGYNSGSTDGYNSGYSNGYNSGYDSGYTNGYTSGYTDGQESASAIQMFNLTVNLQSTDTSGLIGNAVVTVSYNSITSSKTYNGSGLTFEILPGVDYLISFSSVDDYLAPASLTGTSTWNGARIVNATYEYVNPDVPYSGQYFTIEAVEGGNLVTYGNGVKKGYYSKNGGEWIEFTFGATSNTIAMLTGDKVRVKCDDVPAGGGVFYSDGGLVVNVYGNIMSLAYGDNFATATTLNTASAFSSLFARGNNYHLDIIDAGNLIIPVVSLPSSCCTYMFRKCSRLVKAPALPATTIGANCYQDMFLDCTSLTTAPDLPALNLPYSCYAQMFMGCTSLTKAPVISATRFTGSGAMQSMFSGCASLTTSPDLNILDIYDSTTYNGTFSNCTSLNYIKCLGKLGNPTQFTSFTYNVASTGTFVKKTGVTWSIGTMGIPNGWIVVEE